MWSLQLPRGRQEEAGGGRPLEGPGESDGRDPGGGGGGGGAEGESGHRWEVDSLDLVMDGSAGAKGGAG